MTDLSKRLQQLPPEALADAIARLPESEKLVVALLHYEQLSPEAIAAQLGVSSERVQDLQERALLRVLKSIE